MNEESLDGLIRQRKQPVDSRIERQIIIGMITSDRFLREIQPLLLSGKFQTSFANQVSEWCLDYWQKYNKAPGKNIEELFLRHKNVLSEEQGLLTEDFLASINDEYER
ncbi:MAG: hypothetical protein KJ604_20515, partial [Gammaproteobacteria bacterium]|nr:hypothetical protein [Gammaproteobacteria bacterium]